MPFADNCDVSNEYGAPPSQEIQGAEAPSWKSGPARDYPEEWLDPTFKGRTAEEKLHLGFARAFGHVPPLRRYVYFLHDADNDLIKIGVSDDIRKRRQVLARQRRTTLTVLGCVQGDLKQEAEWHARFADIAVEREWFRATPELRAAIVGLAGDLP